MPSSQSERVKEEKSFCPHVLLPKSRRDPHQISYFQKFAFRSVIGRLCGLVVRVLSYRSGGPGSIPGTSREKKVMGLERGTLNLVSTTEELLRRKVAAPV
jgi:hypothetical protein